jgi:protein TonB
MTLAGPRRSPTATRRIAPALLLSVLVHLGLATGSPGGVLRPTGVFSPPVITVRIEPGRTPPVAAASSTVAGERLAQPTVARRAGQATPEPARVEDPATLPPPAEATYFPARQLDVYPALLAPLAPAYPRRALDEGRGGRVLVLVLIDAAGRVDGVSVVEAEPPGDFDEAARRALEAARFSPARRAGVPVRSRVLIHLEFDPASVK